MYQKAFFMNNWVKIASTKDFEKTDRKTFQHFTIFKDGNTYFACENRCPHMGYPLNKGTIRHGVITCAWHNWEFDTQSGGCYRGACEDLKIYPLKIEGEDIFYDKNSNQNNKKELLPLLQEAMRSADIYQQAKVLNQLIAHETKVEDIIETALLHGYRHSIRNHQSEQAVYESQAILDSYLLSEFFAEKEKPPVLLQGVRMASGSTGDRMHIALLPVSELNEARSLELLEKYTKDFSPLGLERILLTITKTKHFQLLAETLLHLATQNYFIGQRGIFIAISSLLRQSKLLPNQTLEEALVAQSAWVLGQTRQEPDMEERDAIQWLNNHSEILEHKVDNHLKERINTTEMLEDILAENSIFNIFDGLEKLLQKEISELDILDGFSVLSARRFARLWVNNGGMWNSASEGIRLCYAIRNVWGYHGKHHRRSLFILAFYFFQTRWLQNGTPWKTKPAEPTEALSKKYSHAFELLNEPEAKQLAIFMLDGKHHHLSEFSHDFCKPLLEDDFEAIQLNTLIAVLNEQLHQKEWQPYIAGMVTYCIDRKLQQNLKAAGKFGQGYFNEEK